MPKEIISSLFLAVISFLACLGAITLGIGQIGSPGPGFFPMILGGSTGILSLIILAGQLRQRRKEAAGQPTFSVRGLVKVGSILAALVAYGFLLEKIGYIFTSFLVFAFLLKMAGMRKWYSVIGGAIIVSIGSYLFFAMLLGVSLPKSPYGI